MLQNGVLCPSDSYTGFRKSIGLVWICEKFVCDAV